MTYDNAVHYLLALGKELAAPRQAHVQKFDLENITRLAQRMGSPHRAIPCVHIAGTNGKGSTAAMLESILCAEGLRAEGLRAEDLRAPGFRTGLYTSPHLERINERIRVAGDPISDDEFAAAFTRVHTLIEEMLASGELPAHPTYFECLTAMAFDYFARAGARIAIYEVGLGGRLDATNIVAPEVAVITQIDFDHEEFLGHSIAQIAAEKAGILKPGATVVIAAGRAEAEAVIRERAAAVGADVVDVAQEYALEEVHAGPQGARARAICQRDNIRLDFSLPLAGR
jgi:dihydrofolate synthase/folylpolyglutamate synthase